jgi:hypothetical protein
MAVNAFLVPDNVASPSQKIFFPLQGQITNFIVVKCANGLYNILFKLQIGPILFSCHRLSLKSRQQMAFAILSDTQKVRAQKIHLPFYIL